MTQKSITKFNTKKNKKIRGIDSKIKNIKSKVKFERIHATSKDLLYKKLAIKYNSTKADVKYLLNKKLQSIESKLPNKPLPIGKYKKK